MEIDAVKKVHKFKQSVELRTTGTEKKPYKPSPGEYFVPKMWSKRKEDGVEKFQTFAEWRDKMAEEDPH